LEEQTLTSKGFEEKKLQYLKFARGASIGGIVTSQKNQCSTHTTAYLNLQPTLITNTIKNLSKKYVTIAISNNLNPDAIPRNSRPRNKGHHNTYSKHQN
jgi:hypothetical protein